MNESIGSRFTAGLAATGLGKITISILGLFSLIIGTRYVAVEEMGAFVFLQVFVIFLSEFSSLGLALIVPKFMAALDSEKEKQRLISTTFYFRTASVLVMCLLVIWGRPLFDRLFQSPELNAYSSLIPFLLPLFVLESLGKFLNSVLQGLFKFNLIGLSDAITSVLNLVGVIFFVVMLGTGLIGLVYARAISYLIAYGFILIRSQIRLSLEFDWPNLKEMLVVGFPLHVNYILTFVFQRIDTLLIGTLLGPTQVAFYEIARRIPDSLSMLYDAFRQVYYPYISRFYARSELVQVSTTLNNSLRWLAFLALLGTVGAFVFGDVVIVTLFSETYAPSVPIFGLMMLGLAVTVVDYTLGYTLVAIGESNKPPIINVVRTLVSFAGYVVLIPTLGIAGAAIASVFSNMLVNPLNMFFLLRKGIKPQIQTYLIPLAIFIGTFISLQFTQSVILSVLMIISFIVINIQFGVIKQQDLQIVFEQIQQSYRSRNA